MNSPTWSASKCQRLRHLEVLFTCQRIELLFPRGLGEPADMDVVQDVEVRIIYEHWAMEEPSDGFQFLPYPRELLRLPR